MDSVLRRWCSEHCCLQTSPRFLKRSLCCLLSYLTRSGMVGRAGVRKRLGVPDIHNITLLVVLKFHLKNSYLPRSQVASMKGLWSGDMVLGQKMWSDHTAHSGSNKVQDTCNLGVQGQFVHRRDNDNGDNWSGDVLWISMCSIEPEWLDPSCWVLWEWWW